MRFGKQPASLILLITELKVIVLYWDGRQLSKAGELGNSVDYQDAFVDLIRQYPELPVLVVTDLIEESFRQDTIVHVGAGDRDALMKRKLDFTFRNTPYRMAKVTGRRKDGRRDDIILMCALIKPDSISGWVSILTEEKRSLQSITSTSFLLQYYLALEKLQQEDNLLIINHVGRNSLRQSYFQQGHLLFSRLSSLHMRPDQNLWSEIYQETIQVRQYLERIQFLPYGISLRVQVFSPDQGTLDNLESNSTETNRIECINPATMLQELAPDLASEPGSASFYQLLRVLNAAKPANVYAPPQATRISDLKNFARNLAYAAMLILCVGAALNVPSFIDITQQWQQRDNLRNRTLPLQREYSQLTNNFPSTPVASGAMELAVQSYEKLATQSRNPEHGLNMLTDALTEAPGLQINSVEWQISAAPFTPFVDSFGTLHRGPEPYPGLSADDIRSILLQSESVIRMNVSGEAYSPDSFREAQEQVLALANALERNPGVSVFATRMPTNVRTDTQVSATVDDGEVRSNFILSITIDDQSVIESQATRQ